MCFVRQFKNIFFILNMFYVGAVYTSEKEYIVNIWIHGANHIPLLKLSQNKYSPLRPYLYAKTGLHLATSLPKHYVLHELAVQYNEVAKDEFPIDSFFIFGWSSSMSFPCQLQYYGKRLSHELSKLIQDLKIEHKNIKVRLIGFSHGGNIALYTIKYASSEFENVTMEVVFLGTPIQELTRSLVNSPYVNKAYSFYTDSDWIQGLELQKFYDLRSSTPLFTRKQFLQSDNVMQVKLTMNDRSFGHWQFHDMKFYLPEVLKVAAGLDYNNRDQGVILDISTKDNYVTCKI